MLSAKVKRSSRFSKTARSLVFIAGWVLFGFVRSISASELCIRALHANSLQISPENSRYYRSVLDRTETFHDLDLTLREATNQRLKEKFRISNDLPIRASAYQKTRFGLSPQAAPSETRGRLILNVEFGYVVSDTFKPIGTLKSVKVSDSGEVLEVVAGSDRKSVV